jgi:hypothetical protein
LPLHIGTTRRADEQVLIDKIGAWLPGWKGRLLTRAGRLALINSVLSSIPIYYMTSFTLSKWVVKRIDRIRRNFLWAGSEEARVGKCWVNWSRVCRPKMLGGLGILDLLAFNIALRLRWNWFRWVDPSKSWHGLNIQLTPTELALFRACTKTTIGNGVTTSFWKCRMDLPGPTASVGTRTDYSVGPWDYPACATRHLKAWGTRTTEEKYSVRKLYMSCAVWKTPRRTRLVLSPYSDL